MVMFMILTYSQCIKKFGTDYRIKKEIKEGRLYQKEKGIYSDKEFCSYLEIISVKYPQAIFSDRSAYYYHGLTDEIPKRYTISTKREGSRIKDVSIKQSFVTDGLYEFGVQTLQYQNTHIRIYSRERLLVDLIRFRSKYPLDYYKEIIGSYRLIVNELDFFEIEDYAMMLKNGENIMNTIQMEVM